MALSRTDIDARLYKLNNLGSLVFVERNKVEGYYLISHASGRHYYDTIREVLSFLAGYLAAKQ